MPRRDSDNLYPRVLAGQTPDEIIVPNGCGAVKVVYSGRRWATIGQPRGRSAGR